jgi:hypothetical protein
MNLAVRVGAPILVDEAVLAESSLLEPDLGDELDSRTAMGGFELPPGQWSSLSGEMLAALHPGPRKP